MRQALRSALIVLASITVCAPAAAQISGRTGGAPPAAEPPQKTDPSWSLPQARLKGPKNAGPCPFVKILYDAGRYQEFQGGRESASAVGYTGEIQGVTTACQYGQDDPIKVKLQMLFAFGKGPTAEGNQRTFRYWVAVTRRNEAVIAKEYFEVPVSFDAGEDRVMQREEIDGIVIPRANKDVSGSNFEILVGFDVTPQMAAFNRDGKRFCVQSGGVVSNNCNPPAASQ